MITQADAVRIVEEELVREDQRSLARGVDPVRAAVVRVSEHELVWMVHWQSAEFARTGDTGAALVGNGPYLVDRVDGGLHRIGAVAAKGGEWETDYRVRVRGMRVRTPVDDLHDEIRAIAAAKGRLPAVRTLRDRLPELHLTHAMQYVSALVEGEVPAHFTAIATARLVDPVDPVLAVTTIHPGTP
ncbi:YrhB domain-containing protein [Streptomyces sp. NPDC088387]|uniref:YrhB domain-containing protein n=1 Tax=Streptomyces sp. NPDC088387 TaxID=3365859 RepID=UPI0037FC8F7A